MDYVPRAVVIKITMSWKPNNLSYLEGDLFTHPTLKGSWAHFIGRFLNFFI